MKIAGKEVVYSSKEFREIFNDFFPSLMLFANKFLQDTDASKDIVQEAFVKSWHKTDEDFESQGALKAYLYVLVKNACISVLRKEKTKPTESIDQHHHAVSEKSFLNEILKEETHKLLADAIASLSPQAQKVMSLTLDGLSIDEIARELQVSPNTIKTVKKRAYKAIREIMGSHYTYLVLIQFAKFFG